MLSMRKNLLIGLSPRYNINEQELTLSRHLTKFSGFVKLISDNPQHFAFSTYKCVLCKLLRKTEKVFLRATKS